jgi:hypothetical protein
MGATQLYGVHQLRMWTHPRLITRIPALRDRRDGPGYRYPMRPISVRRIFCTLASGCVMAVLMASCSSGHGGGDSGGAALSELQKTFKAVPTNASDIRTTATDATWESQCSDGSGHAGWDQALADATFRGASSKTEILTQIGNALSRQGWTRIDVSNSPGQGSVPHWTKIIKGIVANVYAYAVPFGSHHWSLNASWQPADRVDHGTCA